ncbi:hypothetical protein INS49_000157 [Diaporthe citri]|uniref:uncharacterized protein n=1 Tax=Diaporthe citri TaxID=83186 RepID=UPI001C7E7769|nr:uncharacterized protein INS49_000157 [Diaporthe citri]KAG6365981.1 hypothetical protein INS49_000157 [Diaporthe citri]
METWFGTAYTNLPSGKRHVNSKFMKDFELVKQGFNGSGSFQTHRLGLKMTTQASGHYDHDEDEVLLKMWELKSLFDPVVGKIMHLIEEQVRATEQEGLRIGAIMLVGGFGESRYLFEKVDYMWRPKGIKVINPKKS